MCTCTVQLNLWLYSKQTIEALWGHKLLQIPVLSNLRTPFFFSVNYQLSNPVPPHKCSETSPKTHWHSCNTALMQEPTSSFWTLQSYLQAVTALSFTRTSCQLTRTKVKMWPRQLIFGFLHLLDFADQQKLWQMRGGGGGGLKRGFTHNRLRVYREWSEKEKISSDAIMSISLSNVSNTLLNLCHEELRQFWRQKGAQPDTSKVYLIKWPVSVYILYPMVWHSKTVEISLTYK